MDWASPEVLGAIAVVAAAAGAWLIARWRGGGPLAPRTEPPEAPGPDRAGTDVRRALAATGRRFRERLDAALGRAADERYGALEEALLAADVGARTTGLVLRRVRDRVGNGSDAAGIRSALRAELLGMVAQPTAAEVSGTPAVILVTGVNGVGKTTTIGKVAAHHVSRGRKVLLVAADTFRAAAIDQLGVWADRVGADFVRHGQGADPSAVVFDGLQAARARGADVVLIDTAGRLHTRTPLMDELGKIRRTVQREIPGAPHEVLLVLDATTGQNALSQARAFTEAAGVTGVVVTKLDGTAKGGIVLAIREELGLPVRYVGVGEGVSDLRPFDPEEFVAGLLDEG